MARQIMPLVWSRAQLEIDVDRSISEFKRDVLPSRTPGIFPILNIIASMCVTCLKIAIIC